MFFGILCVIGVFLLVAPLAVNRNSSILNYLPYFQLQGWLVLGLPLFYLFALGSIPAVLGYCLGRWMPFYVRVIPLLVILWVCVQVGRTPPGHLVEIYAIGNLGYAYFCRRGLKRKAEKLNVAFEDLPHFDWITAVIATFLIPLILLDW
jgi:hypothetical protein